MAAKSRALRNAADSLAEAKSIAGAFLEKWAGSDSPFSDIEGTGDLERAVELLGIVERRFDDAADAAADDE